MQPRVDVDEGVEPGTATAYALEGRGGGQLAEVALEQLAALLLGGRLARGGERDLHPTEGELGRHVRRE